jgi:APA family basic amino acid/polyamine antiporter
MNNSIWRKKPLEAYAEDVKNSQLKRVLGKWALTSLGIGAVIGGGIFTLTGIAMLNLHLFCLLKEVLMHILTVR